jgi:hypothetical protein
MTLTTITCEEMHRMPWTRDLRTKEGLHQWVASREEAGRVIDVQNCELGHWYAYDADPYGVNPETAGRNAADRDEPVCPQCGKQWVGLGGRPLTREGPSHVPPHPQRSGVMLKELEREPL